MPRIRTAERLVALCAAMLLGCFVVAGIGSPSSALQGDRTGGVPAVSAQARAGLESVREDEASRPQREAPARPTCDGQAADATPVATLPQQQRPDGELVVATPTARSFPGGAVTPTVVNPPRWHDPPPRSRYLLPVLRI